MMHAHIYFDDDCEKKAHDIRELLLLSDWIVFIGRLTKKCVGPHPMPQFEIHFHEKELLKATKQLIAVRDDLSVLVHRVSQNDLLDHTENCFWLGKELLLDYSKLDPVGENQALDRLVLEEAR